VEPPPSLLLCSTCFDLHRATCFDDLLRSLRFAPSDLLRRLASSTSSSTCCANLLRPPADRKFLRQTLALLHLDNKQQKDCCDNMPNPRLLLFFLRSLYFDLDNNERKRSFQSLETPFSSKGLNQKITHSTTMSIFSLFPYHRKQTNGGLQSCFLHWQVFLLLSCTSDRSLTDS
jgi:hypothetical protein